MRRALVISGGGAKGAWAGGVVEYLMSQKGYNYSVGVGSSTGAIMLPHLLINRVDLIKEIYTSVETQDIFSLNPFLISKKDGEFIVKLNHVNILKSFVKGTPTFGDSHKLLRKIRREITFEHFQELNRQDKEVVVTVSNLTKQQLEYKSSKTEKYNDFIDWIWGSANYVPFMSLLNKNGFEYADGGFSTLLPIRAAIDLENIDVVDVIILTPPNIEKNLPKSTNAFQTLSKTYDMSMAQNFSKDLRLGELKSLTKQVEVNIYYTPELLTEYPLVFDPPTMKKWWEMGYQHAKNCKPEKYQHR